MKLSVLSCYLARYLSKNEITLILEFFFGVKGRIILFTQPNLEVSTRIKNQCFNIVRRRQEDVPLAYLLNHCFFYDLKLSINYHCLIPRPDSELLVDQAIECLKKMGRTQPRCLDLATGSGAIILALKNKYRSIVGFGSDISIPAIAIAKKNAQALQLRVEFIIADWGSAFLSNSFDVITANPPYVSYDELHLMNRETSYEPADALFTSKKGISAYQQLIPQCARLLAPSGWLCLEHGFSQMNVVQKLLLSHNFKSVLTYNDLEGQPRVTIGRMGE